MKKIILSVAAVFAFGFANAQEEVKEAGNGGFGKGNIFVSGTVGFSSMDDKDADWKSSNFTISPKVGYFLTENIAIGGQLGYSSSKDAAMDNVMGIDVSGFGSTFSVNTFSVGAFGRYYFTPANQFSLFGELGVNYMTSTIDEVDGVSVDENNKVNGIGAGLGLGMNYFVSKNFALEAGIGVLNFTNAKPDVDGADGVSTFNFGANLSNITFGAIYKF